MIIDQILQGEIGGVKDVHHVPIWAISTTENALSAHLVTAEMKDWSEVATKIIYF